MNFANCTRLVLALISLFVFAHLLIVVSGQNDDDYSDDITDLGSDNLTRYNSTDGLEYDDDGGDDDEGTCTNEAMMERLKEIFLPEDYEPYDPDKITPENQLSIEEVITRLQQYRENVTRKLQGITTIMGQDMMNTLLSLPIGNDCYLTVVRIMNALRNGENWALKFVDSQPVSLGTFLTYSSIPTGNHDQCLSIESTADPDQTTIRGKFCGMDLEPYIMKAKNLPDNNEPLEFPDEILENRFKWAKKNKQYKFKNSDLRRLFADFPVDKFKNILTVPGFCVPTTCTTKEFMIVFDAFFANYMPMKVELKSDCNYEGKEIPWRTFQTVAISIILAFVGLVTLFTLLDNYCPKPSDPKNQLGSWYNLLLYCFSANGTYDELFSLNEKESVQYKCLAFLKLFVPFYIVWENSYVYYVTGKSITPAGSSSSNQVFWGFRRMLYMNHLVLDIFMLVAAILLFNKFDKLMLVTKGKISYLGWAFRRYVKLLPAFITCILIALVYEQIGEGPLWSIPTTYFTESCKNTWYMPLTMLNNILYYWNDMDKVSTYFDNCLPHTWLIATEFQLFLISPIVLVPLYKNPKLGKALLILLLLMAVLAPVMIRVFKETPALFELWVMPNMLKVNESTFFYLTAVWNYAPAYLMGFSVAYLVKNKPKLYLGDRVGECFIMLLTVAMTLSIIIWRKDLNLNTYTFDAFFGFEREVYLFVHKFFYLSSFCWVIYACATGRIEWLNEIMGWEPMRIISNLALEIYMFQMFFVMYRSGIVREWMVFNDFNLWTYGVVDYLFTYLFCIMAALAIMMPMTRLMFGVTNKLFYDENPKTLQDNFKDKDGVANTDEPGIVLKQYTIDFIKNNEKNGKDNLSFKNGDEIEKKDTDIDINDINNNDINNNKTENNEKV